MRLVMIDPISMVAFWLAVWGCSYTLSHLQGPFDLAVNLRRFVLQRTRPTHWLATGIECPICVSFWVALFLYPLLHLRAPVDLREYVVCVLSAVGVAAAIMVLAPPDPPNPQY